MASSIQNYKVLAEEDPQIHWEEMKRAQSTEYNSNGRNPFSIVAAPILPVGQSKPGEVTVPLPQGPPPPPPKPTTATAPPNLKYFGYVVPAGSSRRACITDGEDIYIVPEGQTLLGRYRILKVGNSVLEFQEISSGLPGKMPLEEQAAPPSA
jgi:hypothetical protein